jgi:hypothetical protein
MDKNRDKLHEHLEGLIGEIGTEGGSNQAIALLREVLASHGPAAAAAAAAASTNSSFSAAARSSLSSASNKSGTATLATRFQLQLTQLMGSMDQSTPHFVRCIKPNNSKAPKLLDEALTLQQLRYSGVLEAIQIRKSGFPVRRSHAAFRHRYWAVSGVARRVLSSLGSDSARCNLIAKQLISRPRSALSPSSSLSQGDILVGKTIVFLKADALTSLERLRTASNKRAILRLQSLFRGLPHRWRYPPLVEKFRELRDLILQGQQNKESNVKVLAPLLSALQRAEALGVTSYMLARGMKLAERLASVRQLLGEMGALARSFDQGDLVEEFLCVQSLLAREAALGGVEGGEVELLRAREAQVRERAGALGELRAAVECKDEERLKASLLLIASLSSRLGGVSFCPRDEEQALLLRNRISQETLMLEEVLQIFENAQGEYRRLLSLTSQPADSSTLIRQQVINSSRAVMAVCKPYFVTPPISAHAAACFAVVKDVIASQEAWAKKEWEAVSALLQTMLSGCDALLSSLDN